MTVCALSPLSAVPAVSMFVLLMTTPARLRRAAAAWLQELRGRAPAAD